VVKKGCELMGISRSTYYYRPKKNMAKKKRDADIADAIEDIAEEFPSYGYRRITAALKRRGMVVNHKKVAKIMKKMGVQCRKRKRFAITTDSRHNLRVYPNLAKDLVLDRTDKLWCAAIPIYAFLPALYTWQRLLIHFQDT
jgi:putative transposase